jgi:glutaredoxin-like protein NrdH
MAIKANQVRGDDAGRIMLYSLSTCAWCKKTKRFLNDLGVGYAYVDVDSLPDDERKYVEGEVRRWNPRGSFPTIVVDERECIVGFDENKIRRVLGT